MVKSFVVLSTKLYKKSHTCNFGFIFNFLLFSEYKSLSGNLLFYCMLITRLHLLSFIHTVCRRQRMKYCIFSAVSKFSGVQTANIKGEKMRVKYVTSDNITQYSKMEFGNEMEKIARKRAFSVVNKRTMQYAQPKKTYVDFYGATWCLPKYNL